MTKWAPTNFYVNFLQTTLLRPRLDGLGRKRAVDTLKDETVQ